MPSPPEGLEFGAVSLHFVRIIPGNAPLGFVPSYFFRIETDGGINVGQISFRVGETDHVRICAGHIGYEIFEAYRGNGYAGQACRALGPFIRELSRTVLITCDPDNPASKRTIERLGARFVNEVDVPPNDPHYARGSRRKLRYQWTP